MKKITLLLGMSLVAGIASADIAVELKNNAGTVTQAGGLSDFVDQVLVQLIWTASVPTTSAGIGGALGSGEFLLNSLITTSGYAGTWQDQPQGILEYADTDVGGSDITDGYFFVRMFDNTATGLGDFYLQQGQQGSPLTTYDFQTPSTAYDTNGDLGGMGIDAQGYQVIPEPAGLVGVFGVVLIFIRRVFTIGK